jgi:hypothetical protein
VKKCSSCTKDLPDAALHCVFCGAKQAAAPAAPAANQKTVMGYSAAEMIEQLKAQGLAVPGNLGAPPPQAAPPQAAPYQAPPQAAPYQAPPQAAPYQAPPQAAPYQAPPQAAPYQAPPQAAPYQAPPQASQATMIASESPFAGQYQAPQSHQPPPPQATQIDANYGAQAYPGNQGQPYGAAASQGNFSAQVPAAPAQAETMAIDQAAAPRPGLMGMSSGPQATQIAPSPPQSMPMAHPMSGMQPMQPMQQVSGPQTIAQAPPYLASQTAHRAGRPVEPWKDSLRLMMFIFGVLLLGAFATPISTGQLVFQWDAILHGEGTAKLLPLILAATGLLAVVFAATPLPPAGRGVMATILGLTGIVTPIVLSRTTEWQTLVPLAGGLLLVPGLLIRAEYRDATLPRVMVTIGALATLAPLLVPVGGALPLVKIFQGVINAAGTAKIPIGLQLGALVIVVLTLLAWLPSPSGGGAKVFAWLLLGWAAITHIVDLVVKAIDGAPLVDMIKATPNETLVAWVPAMAYAVLIGYGLASVLGKQLE